VTGSLLRKGVESAKNLDHAQMNVPRRSATVSNPVSLADLQPEAGKKYPSGPEGRADNA